MMKHHVPNVLLVSLVIVILGGALVGVVFLAKENFNLRHRAQNGPLKIGDKAPNFELWDMDGKKVNLEGLKGKSVLLYFFTTGCGICKRTAPYWERVLEWHKDKELVLYGICSSDVLSTKDFLTETQVSFSALYDPEGEVERKYKVSRSSQGFLINKNGELVFIEDESMSVEDAIIQVDRLLEKI